ncbi:MAG TPA: peptidoglycan glycosyltransferase [Ruminococcus sp.]|nr:peptidoglycan glycosyltransferase [Ruminococcus sp.]
MKKRTRFVMTIVFFLLFSAVAGNFFKISVIENKRYQAMANDQHFGAITIPAHRGTIYDCNNITLAKSATVYRVFLDPQRFRNEMEEIQNSIDRRNAEKAKGTYVPRLDEDGNELYPLPQSSFLFRQEAVAFLSEKLGITKEKVENAMEENSQYSKLQDQVEKPVADEVLNMFTQYNFTCLQVEEDTKRYYPQNQLAAPVLGFTSGDGDGVYGIEAYYDNYLAGIDGKTISAKDSNGNELPYRYSKTYAAKNGDDVYLTIDMNIQYYLEKHLEEMGTKFNVANRSCAILMNAKTGAIYGMATYPGFDPNQPQILTDERIVAQINQLSEELRDKREEDEREKQWRNKCISDVYEPGSVFKVFTSSAAIEENVIDPNTYSYECLGHYVVNGVSINCHDTSGHGPETFQKALTDSCNPVFMDIGLKMGIEKFSYYFNAFGFWEKTGIDLPAEVHGVGHEKEDMSEVDLAVDSFGQGETVTPMEMITAYAAVINGGFLLQPYVVDHIQDQEGNIVLRNQRTVKRQVISEDTSAKMRDALEKVVSGNGGGNVTIKGYSIGGKSGTSERLSLGRPDEDLYGASYVCFTPAYDPELILLVLADMPDASIGYYGSQVAVPTARDILTDVLPYLGYSPEYTDEEAANLDIKVPFLEGSITAAKETIESLGGQVQVIGKGPTVIAQSPVTGTAIAKGGTVFLYTEEEHQSDYTTVPSFVGLSPEQANERLAMYGLNYVARGASVNHMNVKVNSQSVPEGTKVPVGTSIELEFIVFANQD